MGVPRSDAPTYSCSNCGREYKGTNRNGENDGSDGWLQSHRCHQASQGMKLSTKGRNALLAVFSVIAALGAFLITTHFSLHVQALLKSHVFTALKPYALGAGIGGVALGALGFGGTVAIDRKLNKSNESGSISLP